MLATIGGDDQITVLPHLDPGVVVACPKPFAGYSDNTNLLDWLWNLGVPSYHGGSTMVHLGRGGRLHPASSGSLRAALIDGGDLDLRPVVVFNEDELEGAAVQERVWWRRSALGLIAALAALSYVWAANQETLEI